MAKKKVYISVPNGSVAAICNELNVKKSAVYNALNYNSNSETAQQIRRLATSTYGGREATKIMW